MKEKISIALILLFIWGVAGLFDGVGFFAGIGENLYALFNIAITLITIAILIFLFVR